MTSYSDTFGGSSLYEAEPKRAAYLRDPRLWKACAIAALGCAICLGAFEYFLVLPAIEGREAMKTQLSRVAAENRQNEATLADYEQFLATKADTDRRYDEATAAIPTEAELATVLETLRGLAETSRMQLVKFTPDRAAGADMGGALRARKVQVSVRGSYAALERLLSSLGEFPRLLTVDGFSIKTSTEASSTLEATISMTCYFKSGPAPAR